MADAGFDFAIMGSTPLAGLLAGLLQTAHGKTVCLIGEAWSPFRLPRRHDISVAMVTRPETWALLTATSRETLKLLGTLGKGLSTRIDPLFVADTAESADALAHLRHMARACGYAVERVADRTLTETGAACRIRDALLLASGRVEPAIEGWLERSGVQRLVGAVEVNLRRDGSARIAAGSRLVEAAQAVVADDEAIALYLDPGERDRVLAPRSCTVMLTEPPTRPLAAPIIDFIDRDVVLAQHGKAGVLAIAGDNEVASAIRIGSSLGPLAPLQRAGEARFDSFVTVDGAPLIGSARGLRAIVLAGFGASGAFLAPAVARQLAGVAKDAESSWFAAREPARGNARRLVVDFVAPEPAGLPS